MKKQKLYVVTMYKFGDREMHSYFLGVFSKKQAADKAGDMECAYRGGKYKPEVEPVVVDSFDAASHFGTLFVKEYNNGNYPKNRDEVSE